MNKIGYILALLSLLISTSAQAQEVATYLLIVKHRFATPAQQQALVKDGLKRLNKLGVNPKIVKIKVVSDRLNKNLLSQYTSRLDAWYKFATQKGYCKKGELCHLSLPPVFDSAGVDYGGGVAFDSCSMGSDYNASFSIARIKNGKGLPRVEASKTSTAHEVGHNVGAEHYDKKANIMNSDALKFGEVALPWVKETSFLVDACMYYDGNRKVSKYGFRSFRGKIVEPLQP